MEEVITIIKSRILLAEEKKRESKTLEMSWFWDGQVRCAQALLNEVAHLTMRAADLATTCARCGYMAKYPICTNCGAAIPPSR